MTEKVTKNERRAVLVLGMHRSGTSAVTRVLNMLGAAIGGTLIAPGYDNPTGFWEHSEVVRINEELLNGLGRTWYDMREMPKGWIGSAAGKIALEQATQLIERDFSDTRLCVVKDPRMCLTARVWVDAFRATQFEVACLFVVRDPREVADSLHRRNHWPRTPLYLMWVQYLLEAIACTHDCRRSMITYDQTLADWRHQMNRVSQNLHLKWPVAFEAAESDIDMFLDPRQRHHKVDSSQALRIPDESELPALVSRLYGECLALAAGRGEWRALSEQYSGFQKVAELYAAQLDRLLKERWEAEGRAQTAESHLTEQASMPAIVQDAMKHLSERLDGRLHEIKTDVTQRVGSVHAAVQGVDAQLNEVEAEVIEQVMSARDATAALEARLGEVEGVVADLISQMNESGQRVQLHHETLRAVEARLQRQYGLLNTTLLRLEQLAEDRLANRIDGISGILHDHRQMLDTINTLLGTELQKLRQARDQSQEQLSDLTNSTSWRLTRPLRWLSVNLLRRPRGDV